MCIRDSFYIILCLKDVTEGKRLLFQYIDLGCRKTSVYSDYFLYTKTLLRCTDDSLDLFLYTRTSFRCTADGFELLFSED